MVRPKEHKQRVPCAIAAADSGKTSLFSPVFRIVPLSRIARVTKQKNFNKVMIDDLTEAIFLDEAYPGLLDIDDWKIRCKGASRRTTQSGKKPKGFIAARPCILLAKWKWILVWITMKLWRNGCPSKTSRDFPVLIQKKINGSRNTLWIVLCGRKVS